MSVPNIKEARPTVGVGQRVAETAASPPRKAEDSRHVEARTVTAVERDRIVKRLQELARESGRALEFRVDESSEKMVIVVRDQDTGEMIRQIPDATALRIAQRLESQVEALRSVLFEGRV
jgi:flagellar protein FlaG